MTPLEQLAALMTDEGRFYITEFKNQFDQWQMLHATRNKEKAFRDAGSSGRVIEVVRSENLELAKVWQSVAMKAIEGCQYHASDEFHPELDGPKMALDKINSIAADFLKKREGK